MVQGVKKLYGKGPQCQKSAAERSCGAEMSYEFKVESLFFGQWEPQTGSNEFKMNTPQERGRG